MLVTAGCGKAQSAAAPLEPYTITVAPGITKPEPKPEPLPDEVFTEMLLEQIEKTEPGGGYYTGAEIKPPLTNNAWVSMDEAFVLNENGAPEISEALARPSFCSCGVYMLIMKTLSLWDVSGQVSPKAWEYLKPYSVNNGKWAFQTDGTGCWGMANANGPGFAVMAAELGIGESFVIPMKREVDEEKYFSLWQNVQPGDVVKLFWNDNVGSEEKGHLVIFLKTEEATDKYGRRDDTVTYWSSNGSGFMPDGGYGVETVSSSKITRAVVTRISSPGAFAQAENIRPDKVNEYLNSLLTMNSKELPELN